nr:hypothetical protein [Stenotrophomonas pavanii]
MSSSSAETSFGHQVNDGRQFAVLLKLNGVGSTWSRISKRYANSAWGIPSGATMDASGRTAWQQPLLDSRQLALVLNVSSPAIGGCDMKTES